jgi:hypothetical protein
MKTALLSLVAIFTAFCASGEQKHKPVDLTGSWKEVRRVSPRGEALDYTDTTYYDFLIGNEYTVQRQHSFMYRGTYKTTPGTLDLGMRMYNVLEWSPNRILLKDDDGTYQFARYVKPPMHEDNTAASSSERAYKEEVAGSHVGLDRLRGKWEVYKRTSSATLPEIDYTRIVRVLVVNPGKDMLGTVGSAKDMDGMPSWKIDRYENGILYCSSASKGPRQLKVLSCKDGELIVQEDVVTYFFKQFK